MAKCPIGICLCDLLFHGGGTAGSALGKEAARNDETGPLLQDRGKARPTRRALVPRDLGEPEALRRRDLHGEVWRADVGTHGRSWPDPPGIFVRALRPADRE